MRDVKFLSWKIPSNKKADSSEFASELPLDLELCEDFEESTLRVVLDDVEVEDEVPEVAVGVVASPAIRILHRLAMTSVADWIHFQLHNGSNNSCGAVSARSGSVLVSLMSP